MCFYHQFQDMDSLFNVRMNKEKALREYMQSMMKISVITDISVLRFYRYIEYIGDILTDILKKKIDKPKIDQNL